MSKKIVIPPGTRFARLVVVAAATAYIDPKRGWSKPQSLCQCDCGNQCIIRNNCLKTGNTKSCGCFKNEGTTLRHGCARRLAKSPEYRAWVGMRKRCQNPNEPSYVRYGARGITICEHWNTFENFLADMGAKPTSLHSIERIDNNGNYEPGNCKWGTDKEQARNKSTTLLVIVNGVSECLATLAERSGLDYMLVWERIFKLQWAPETALSKPARIKTSARERPPL